MRTGALAAALVLGCLAAGCGATRSRPELTVSPASALVDTPFRIHVTNVPAGERVTIAAFGRSHLGRVWRAVLTARADSRGQVDLRNVYLLARLRPPRKPPARDYLPWEQKVRVVAQAGDLRTTGYARRILTPASVSVTDERPRMVGFYGEWFTRRGVRRHSAILLLGGSNGGLASYLAASMLAARGYPVLALAYFRAPGLPRTLERIPLEYFRRALEWMRTQREVDPARIVTFGVSRGGELSLILASTFLHLVHGAVAYVPSSSANNGLPDTNEPAWTYRGTPVVGVIPVERIAGPVFAVGGGDDALWPSGLFVEDIALARQGHPGDVMLTYQRAGHSVGLVVPNQAELTTTVDSIYGPLALGGSPSADEAARQASWPRLLRFLAKL